MTLTELDAEAAKAEARYEAAENAYCIRPNAHTRAAMEHAGAWYAAIESEREKRHFGIDAPSIEEDGERIRYTFTASAATLRVLKEAAECQLEYENDARRVLYCMLLSAFKRMEKRNDILAED